MWVGVTIGLARIKFSGSPRAKGVRKTRISNTKKKIRKNKISLEEKY